ncbi:MAG: RHS domain-containing protein [Acidobacteria bacterium]|nr:RHS domain-containing protein [Acidobacteriota bacterium]MBI3658188.1 RHS domain-containing protein [Acidobacteriota bacterium]
MNKTLPTLIVALGLASQAHPQPRDARVAYYHTDHLGSVRMVTDTQGNVLHTADYLPFGEVLGSQSVGGPQFTGKLQDPETAWHYFGARYFSSPQARFLSPDKVNPILGAGNRTEADLYLSNPQHWNRYPYSLNSPLKYVDPDGNYAILAQWLQRIAAHPLTQRGLSYLSAQSSRLYDYGRGLAAAGTSYLLTPSGQQTAVEVGTAVIEGISGVNMPYGFGSYGQFQSFSRTAYHALGEAGHDASLVFRGSSVTGFAMNPAKVGKAFGAASDFDLALVGKDLFGKAVEAGAIRYSKTRTDILNPFILNKLGLRELAEQLQKQAGRKVSFVVYESEEALKRRGPYMAAPR